ncbi:H(+)-ATPase [Conidiobolus coronatus NRRL 28638]|uniref:Plasma membrane ATPase n=1 Tax=Conidiobolus coronatus (strain ATCC 28846 / CBS 209.66 / NRRL 28638) TaxID=796925 RepID=A0A137PA13_CONC2|nr:H(+)-ATPase [Conidiobolus coronatus NRRL 28638]|eukprot:KXN71838.1 H(+)-ATPase [Conidiobolus coronatus NRRL 28638]
MTHAEEKKDAVLVEHEHKEVQDELPAELEALLQTDTKTGLTTAEHAQRLADFGLNELPEKKTNPFLKFIGYFTDPIAILIIIALILSCVVHDWVDVGIIAALLVLNAVIGFAMEAKAESALDALKSSLSLKSKCWRNGELVEVDTNQLVPGDVIVLRLGDIVPADARLLGIGATGEATHSGLDIDQSALTGESLPVHKNKGDIAYSSSIVKQGQMLAVVVKTGSNTFIGRAANLISITNEQGHFQKIIGQIGNFLVIITVVMVVVLFGYLMGVRGAKDVLPILSMIVVLAVAAIPVGLPTVLSVTMAVGANQLAAKQVIVKRLTAVEEMSSVTILCSDKTGTLTLNQLTFDKPFLCEGYSEEDLLLYSYIASEPGANDPIEKAVRKAAQEGVSILKGLPKEAAHAIPGYKVTSFMPFNPTSKRTQATVVHLESNESFEVSKGAPPTMIKLVGGHDEAVHAVNDLAGRGLRALGVARTFPGKPDEWHLVGMISLLDPPRPDSADTVAKCHHYGVDVKMITGDQLIIAKEVAHRLGMQRAILDANKLVEKDVSEEDITRRCEHADGFAQVIPEHKYRVVELLQNKGHLVGMTGDGVNDAPALKKANVGIAVHDCTDAARSAADIVLLAPGLSTIIDGITTSRAIFQRMRSYSLYRITSTVHILIFFFLIILIEQWSMQPILLIFIAVLNDLATIVIAFDNAQISQKPDKWRIGQLIFMSILLGCLLTALSFGHIYVTESINPGDLVPQHGEIVHPSFLQTVMYLHISSAPHFLIFSTRLSGFFWENLPSWFFFVAVMGTQVFAMIISIVGINNFIHGIGPAWGFVIIFISLGFCFILDAVKVFMFRIWSFEFTTKLLPTPSRKRKLEQRKARAIVEARVTHNISRLKKALTVTEAVRAFSA